tara:strand:+ start:312 stop:455 length:144 start_codon:yes stop_codon:yes gene_type:complete
MGLLKGVLYGEYKDKIKTEYYQDNLAAVRYVYRNLNGCFSRQEIFLI